MTAGYDERTVTTTIDHVFDAFRIAQPEFSPCPLWWWSGDTLEPERLKRQMERYRDGGIWNLVVINLAPSGPLYGHFADDPPFMSDRWWEMFLAVCAHARQLGMRIWFYDQIGFSGANIQGQLIAQHSSYVGQTIDRVTVNGDGSAMLACPQGGTPLIATLRPLGEDGSPVGPPQPVPIIDGAARWSGAGKARLSLCFSSPGGFDYFNVDACAALIDAIHGEFERHAGDYFHDVIAGTSQDELPPMPRWSTQLAREFERIHGYDLVPLLDGLWEDIDGLEERVRRDYHATRASLAERAIFKPLFDWHDQRGMIAGVDQQNPARAGDPEGGVRIYADYMKTHRWYGAPGSDHHGEAKIHSSLAHLYGRDRVWLEAFHTSGWGGTLEETFDWLLPWLRGGVTLYNPHATYYGTRGGWFEWAPPSTDWRQPYWSHYRIFADAVGRLSWLLGSGVHACDVGLVYPTATIQAGLGLDGTRSTDARTAHDIYLSLVGRMVWFNQHTGVLDAIGVDYDILDDDSIASGTTDEGLLHIADESYRTVVLPSCSVLDRATAEALVRFVEADGEVLVLGRPPSRLTGGPDDQDRLIDRLVTRCTLTNEAGLQERLAGHDTLVSAPVPTLVRRLDKLTVVFVPGVFPGASEITGWPIATIDFDRSRYADTMTIRVRGVHGAPQLWDPFRGTRSSIPASRCHSVPDGVEVDVPLDGAPCAVLVWGANVDAEPTPDMASAHVIANLDGTWEVELVPTMDNQWGDFTYPASTEPIPVQQWTFERPDVDDVVTATFGPRARWTGPGAPEELLASDLAMSGEMASWSLSRGIHKDPLHHFRLGAAGHVAEEFMDFGPVQTDQAVRVRSYFDLGEVDGYEGWLVVGAAAEKRLWIDGTELSVDADEHARYQTAVAVTLGPGVHSVDLLLTARHELRLRAWFALVSDLESFRRPDRLTVLDGARPGSSVRFERPFTIDGDVRSARLQIGTRGPARVHLDNREIGRQGGFLPYGDGSATQRYDVTDLLSPGDHVLAVTIEDAAIPITLVVDGVMAFDEAASPELWLMTDRSWTAARDGVPVDPIVERRPVGDPQLTHLRQRPHPLPGASWLEGDRADSGVVRPTAWFTDAVTSAVHLRCTIPPGATEALIPVVGRASAWLEGEPIGDVASDPETTWTVSLPNPERSTRILELTIETVPGYSGGAVLTGPIEYTVGPGHMALGNWAEQGLADYSGIVTYRQRIPTPETPEGDTIWLDLGHIRGSAAVSIDGRDVLALVAGPFRVEVTEHVRRAGSTMSIEIDIANTLGPYLDATSPTPFVLAGQTVSGLFGPVCLLHVPRTQ